MGVYSWIFILGLPSKRKGLQATILMCMQGGMNVLAVVYKVRET